MERFETANGYTTISPQTVRFDVRFLHSARQLYRRSKLLAAVLAGCLLYSVAMVVLRPDFFPWELVVVAALFVGAVVGWKYVRRRWLSGPTREVVGRASVERVVYSEGGRLRQPEMAVVYRVGGEESVRRIVFPFGFIGGREDLDDAKAAFRNAGIEVKSVDELD